ncbi:hypothetical protein NOC27_1590 [Nitrosococcus oceani AFC27]|nr:hypothetical protein NOC27_1590 [Nitrosococcus oceani AFC27]
MLRQRIEYKGYLRGCAVELGDRFSPSSLDVSRLQPIS